jgi:serine protease Do
MSRINTLFIGIILIIGPQLKSFAENHPNSFADLAEKLIPSVVNISTTSTIVEKTNPFPNNPFGDMFKEFGVPQQRDAYALGSGFIIDEKGIVITNNHVIDGAKDIVVQVNGETEFKAKVLGADPLTDIAVLQIDTDVKLNAVKFGDSDDARIGDWVIAIGNPFGLGGTVTSGIISAKNRNLGTRGSFKDLRYQDFIQTDASINTGNSGGPLFDMSGNVIGINTAILGLSGNVGIGFAIPSNMAKDVIDQLIKFGETKRGWLGVRIQDVTKEIADVEKLDEPRGALVASVAENSPSAKAGVKAGDIILEFDGQLIKKMSELPTIVAKTAVGKKVKVKIWRNKKEITKTIVLGRLETSEAGYKAQKEQQNKEIELTSKNISSIKISVKPLTSIEIKDKKIPNQTTGIVITNIEESSPFKSLKVGDIIVEVQKKRIRDIEDFEKIIEKSLNSSEKTILVVYYDSSGKKNYIGIRLE